MSKALRVMLEELCRIWTLLAHIQKYIYIMTLDITIAGAAWPYVL